MTLSRIRGGNKSIRRIAVAERHFQEVVFWHEALFLKSYEKSESRYLIFPSASSAQNRKAPHQPLVRRFLPRLQTGWDPYAFERLKHGIGSFVRDCRSGRFCARNIENGTKETIGRPGRLPSLPMAFPDSDSTQFCLIGLRQNAQGKGNADGSILKQDKRRASQVTPA